MAKCILQTDKILFDNVKFRILTYFVMPNVKSYSIRRDEFKRTKTSMNYLCSNLLHIAIHKKYIYLLCTFKTFNKQFLKYQQNRRYCLTVSDKLCKFHKLISNGLCVRYKRFVNNRI